MHIPKLMCSFVFFSIPLTINSKYSGCSSASVLVCTHTCLTHDSHHYFCFYVVLDVHCDYRGASGGFRGQGGGGGGAGMLLHIYMYNNMYSVHECAA
jgi:hypothetical protein